MFAKALIRSRVYSNNRYSTTVQPRSRLIINNLVKCNTTGTIPLFLYIVTKASEMADELIPMLTS